MAGRTPAEAVNAYLGPLSRAVSCVTKGVLNVSPGGYVPEQEPHLLVFGSGFEVLRGGFVLTLQQGYAIVPAEGERGPWKCSTTWYQYSLDDAERHEIVAYHWHPGGASDVRRPHLHLGAGAGVQHEGVARAHLPTGRVSIEDFLLLAICDLGVEPLRQNWRDILEGARDVFEDWQTWPRPGQPVDPN